MVTDKGKLTRYQDATSVYLSHCSLPLYFGLGEATKVERVEVTVRPSRITEEKLWRVVLSFGAPLVVAMMFHALFNLVDLYIVAQIPNIASEAIVAVTIGGIITMIPMVILVASFVFVVRIMRTYSTIQFVAW